MSGTYTGFSNLSAGFKATSIFGKRLGDILCCAINPGLMHGDIADIEISEHRSVDLDRVRELKIDGVIAKTYTSAPSKYLSLHNQDVLIQTWHLTTQLLNLETHDESPIAGMIPSGNSFVAGLEIRYELMVMHQKAQVYLSEKMYPASKKGITDLQNFLSEKGISTSCKPIVKASFLTIGFDIYLNDLCGSTLSSQLKRLCEAYEVFEALKG